MQLYQTSMSSPVVITTFAGVPTAQRCNLCCRFLQPILTSSPHRLKVRSLSSDVRNLRVCSQKWSLHGGNFLKDGNLMSKGRRGHMLMAGANGGFNFGGGGGWGDGNTKRILGNLALAIGLTYLSMTGQLGWILDAILSLWLLAVILPVLGIGAFIWLAGRDIVQDSCPNCGNKFQILKSSLKEEGVQLCPYCAQPFSVQGNKFVRESARFSSDRSYGQVFNGFSGRTGKETTSAGTIVDIEAEVKDVD